MWQWGQEAGKEWWVGTYHPMAPLDPHQCWHLWRSSMWNHHLTLSGFHAMGKNEEEEEESFSCMGSCIR